MSSVDLKLAFYFLVHWKKKQKSDKSSSNKEREIAADVKLIDAEKEQSKHAASLAFATAVAAEAAVAAAHAAAEVVRLTSMPHYTGKTMEEIAAVKIQTAFRGYMVTNVQVKITFWTI